MYAVIAAQGHQFIVQEWLELTIDRLVDTKEGDSVTFEEVYCVFDADGKKVSVGKPTVKGAKVTAKVLEHKKWIKTRVLKFQGKKRYQRIKWFRPYQTVVSIEKITA